MKMSAEYIKKVEKLNVIVEKLTTKKQISILTFIVCTNFLEKHPNKIDSLIEIAEALLRGKK